MNRLVGEKRLGRNSALSVLLTILQTSHPLSTLPILLSLLFCLCLFKNTQDLGSSCLCRRQLVSASLQALRSQETERERQIEKEMAKQRGSKVIHLILETGAGYECSAVLERTPSPSPVCSLSRRGEVPTMPDHNMALKNTDCSFWHHRVLLSDTRPVNGFSISSS